VGGRGEGTKKKNIKVSPPSRLPKYPANWSVTSKAVLGTVGHKSDDPCVHKKYTEAGVMTFVAHCTGSNVYWSEVKRTTP